MKGSFQAAGSLLSVPSLEKAILSKNSNRMDVTKKRSQHQIKNGDILLSYIGMLAMGKPQFDAVNEMHDDKEFYKAALGIASDIPSEATLRQRMDDIGDTIRKQIQKENVSMLVSNGIVPNKSADGCVHVDLDVSPHDRCFQDLQRLRRICTHARLYRDARILHQYRTACRIAAFPKKALPDSYGEPSPFAGKSRTSRSFSAWIPAGKDSWYGMAKQYCKNITSPREGKTVYIGSDWRDISYKTEKGDNKTVSLRIVYEIIVRETDKYGQYLSGPQVEVDTFWTNLGLSGQEVINNYHAHGECEQYHSELKTDMDLERLPSGKFDTNALVLELSMIAFNILRMIGQKALGKKNPKLGHAVQRRRHRTVINNLVNMACHVIEHARQMVIGLGCSNVWRDVFRHVHAAFA